MSDPTTAASPTAEPSAHASTGASAVVEGSLPTPMTDDERRQMFDRQQILKLVDVQIKPFQQLIDEFAAIDGFQDIEHDLLPDFAKQAVTFIKDRLREGQPQYEDMVVNIIRKYLTTDEVQAILDVVKHPIIARLKKISQRIQQELIVGSSEWYNAVLEPHVETIKKMFPVIEPATLEETIATAPLEDVKEEEPTPEPSAPEPPSAA